MSPEQLRAAIKSRERVQCWRFGWNKPAEVRVMAIAERYAMVRCKGAIPFVVSFIELAKIEKEATR